MNSIGRKQPTHIGKLPISLAYLDCLFFHRINVVTRRFVPKQSPLNLKNLVKQEIAPPKAGGVASDEEQERPRNDMPLVIGD